MSITTADILNAVRHDPKRLAAVNAQMGVPAAPPRVLPRPRMNKTEAAYARRLESMKFNGEIAGYAFEAQKLRLAEKTYYTPDFLVWMTDGRVEYHETKGFEHDDAAVKFKTAAEAFPFARFLMVRKAKGGVWETLRDIPARVHDKAVKP